ncbi:DUF5995 family protein [Belliella kenyensis]|uniref:DUF5995 family protein n=1 Tax=Belliella kenyensis TaxID=1472724 RepID=A0ABV8EMI4_9BACT|nr:DUF5995 family protein [Belliella kenyensis]MCH7403594.1 DUF5995 family protein [Belliella kenyensis]MDN3603854.1 DUF5995 family protein [Belliella kenyensis]
MNTIQEVITKMDQIIEECESESSRIGYFAILYRQVTVRIALGIADGEFEDNPRMEILDIIFAKRFIDAYEGYKSRSSITISWQTAFDAAKDKHHIVLQHLLLGINAHINLDLGIAAVETVGAANLSTIKNDFDNINGVLGELVDGVKNNIGALSPLFRLLIKLAKGKDEILVNFSISVARDGAWRFANDYYLALDKAECISTRDQIIAGLAEEMIRPGTRLSNILRIISFTEWRSVTSNMKQLDHVVKTAGK